MDAVAKALEAVQHRHGGDASWAGKRVAIMPTTNHLVNLDFILVEASMQLQAQHLCIRLIRYRPMQLVDKEIQQLFDSHQVVMDVRCVAPFNGVSGGDPIIQLIGS